MRVDRLDGLEQRRQAAQALLDVLERAAVARQRIVDAYAWPAIARRTVARYRDVLARRGVPG